MKTKITWFIIGFVVSCLMLGSVTSYIFLLPKDYSQLCSESDEPRILNWLKSAKGRRVGAFNVYTPSDSSNASAIIHPAKPNCFPNILIQDYDKDGKLDTIDVTDSAHHTVYIGDNGDGVIDSHGCSLGEGTNSISYYDSNMDGQYDTRFNSVDSISVFIDSQWHDIIIKDKEKYIDIDGALTQVKLGEDGTWRIIEK